MFPPDLVHVLGRALVASVPRGDVELEVEAGALEVVIESVLTIFFLRHAATLV